MSFYQLFLANLRMLYRNWRALFFNILMPVFLYVVISKIAGGSAGPQGAQAYSDYLLPGIIAMTIMQTGVFSLAYWLVDLKARGVIKRFMVTPLSTMEMVGSLIASRLVLMALQIVILTLIGKYFFHAHVNGSIVAIILLMILGGATFLGIGFLISTAAKTYEEASPITTVVNLIFTFLGNIFFPTTVMPQILQKIGAKLPVTYLAQGMRHNFVEMWTFQKSIPDLIGLAVWLVVILLATAYTFRLKQD